MIVARTRKQLDTEGHIWAWVCIRRGNMDIIMELVLREHMATATMGGDIGLRW